MMRLPSSLALLLSVLLAGACAGTTGPRAMGSSDPSVSDASAALFRIVRVPLMIVAVCAIMSRMQKTDTAGWLGSGSLKEELEEAARSRNTSVTDLLEQIVREWLERSRVKTPKVSEEDAEERQQRLRAELRKLAGSIEGDDPHRAENARYLVQERLARKYGR